MGDPAPSSPPVTIVAVEGRVLISPGLLARISQGQFERREIVLVAVRCSDGTVGYGEAFSGSAGSAVAELVNTALAPIVVGRAPHETAAVSGLVRHRLMNSHAASSAFRYALAGIDLAMWDAHGKLAGVPVYQLLGGTQTSFPAYAGSFALGIQPPDELVAEARELVDRQGWTVLKLRIGADARRDLAGVRAVREAFGDEMRIAVDSNMGQHYELGQIAAALGELGVEWLEEPYERPRRARYIALRARGTVPIAGGENLRSAEEFFDWTAAGALDVCQPDASRVGGITEMLRIAAVVDAAGLRFVPHISHSALNHAASLHIMSAIGSQDLCEGDAAPVNAFRDGAIHGGVEYHDGMMHLTGGPGLGVEVDEGALESLAG